jgi:predicted PurR-regulated permease PerM
VNYHRLRTILITLGIGVATVWLLQFLWGLVGNFGAVVVTLLLAWIINLIALGPVRFMHHRRIPRSVAATAVYIIFVGVAALASFFVLPPLFGEIGRAARNLTSGATAVPQILEDLQIQLAGWGVPQETIRELVTGFNTQIVTFGQDVAAGILGSTGAVLSGLGLAILTLIISFYILLGWDTNLRRLRHELPSDWRARFDRGIRSAERTFGGWLGGQAVASTVWGTAVVAIYIVSDIPFGILVAVSTGLLMFIPFVGLAVGVAVPIAMAAMIRVDLAIWVGISVTAISLVIENIVKPRIMGTALGVNPLVVILSVIVGGVAAGFWGIVFGIPIGALVWTFVRWGALEILHAQARLLDHPDEITSQPELASGGSTGSMSNDRSGKLPDIKDSDAPARTNNPSADLPTEEIRP